MNERNRSVYTLIIIQYIYDFVSYKNACVADTDDENDAKIMIMMLTTTTMIVLSLDDYKMKIIMTAGVPKTKKVQVI